MNLKARLAIVFLLLISIITTATGTEPVQIKPVPVTEFRPVLIAPGKPEPVRVPIMRIEDPLPVPSPKPSKAPKREQPKSKPTVKTTTTKLQTPKLSGKMRKGVASYYCNANPKRGKVSRCTRGYPDGKNSYYAAIRKDLLFLRGKRVKVSANGRSLWVRIIDCNCGRGANLIDLYGDSFAYFYPLTKGRFNVKISW